MNHSCRLVDKDILISCRAVSKNYFNLLSQVKCLKHKHVCKHTSARLLCSVQVKAVHHSNVQCCPIKAFIVPAHEKTLLLTD